MTYCRTVSARLLAGLATAAALGCTADLGPGADLESGNGPAGPGAPSDPVSDTATVCHADWQSCLGPTAAQFNQLGCNDSSALNRCANCEMEYGSDACANDCASWNECQVLREVDNACDDVLYNCYAEHGLEIDTIAPVEPSEDLPANAQSSAIAISPGPGVAASGVLSAGGDFYRFVPGESWEGCRFVLRLPGYYLDDVQQLMLFSYSALTLFEDGAARTDASVSGGTSLSQNIHRWWVANKDIYFHEDQLFYLRVRAAPDTGIPSGHPYDLQLVCVNSENSGTLPDPLPAL